MIHTDAIKIRPIQELLDELGLSDYTPTGNTEHVVGDPGREVFLILQSLSNQTGERLLLKERRAYLSEAEFRLHIELHRHLFRNGAQVIPIPAAFVDKLPLLTTEGRLFDAQVWVEGRRLDPNSITDLAMLGDALAQFHIAATDFPWSVGADVHGEPRQRFDKADYYRPLLNNGLSGFPDTLEALLYELLERARVQLRAVYQDFGPEHEQPIHGDPDTHNALLIADKCLLLDFDDAHQSTQAADLAWLITLCAGLKHVKGPVPYTFRFHWSGAHLRAILDAYLTRAPLCPTGHKALRWWLVASVVCAVVDCFFHDGCLINALRLRAECEKAIQLIYELEYIELCLAPQMK